jgi:hypothetical protein
MQGSPFPRNKVDKIALAIISFIIITAMLLAYSNDDIPRLDDWTYAWSVEHFHRTGMLRVLDWSAHYPLAQIIWAAGFTKIFGFSFAILRVSTLVLSFLGLIAFYLTLRIMNIELLPSILGTLALLFNPVFFVLGHSFMTDIPFVSTMNIAILGYVLWVQQRRAVWLCLGSVFALISFLIRQIGAVLPLLPLLYLLLCHIVGERRELSLLQIIYLLFPFLGIGLTLWWIRDIHGPTSVYLGKTDPIDYFLSLSLWLSSQFWWTYFQGFGHALAHLSLMLCPLSLASLRGRSRSVLLFSSALVTLIMGLYLWHFGELPQILHYGETLSLEELGASRPLLSPQGEDLSRHIPAWIACVLLGLSLTSGIAMVATLLENIWHRASWVNQPSTMLLFNSLLQFLVIDILWFYYDRYYLPLLPGLIVALVTRIHWVKVTQTVIVIGVLIFAVISISGTLDNERFNRAVAQAREWLLHQQVAPWQIDAGYALNGWWLYAHPENLQPGTSPESDVPFITSKALPSYSIANSPTPFYEVIRAFTWQALWAISNKIYVLKRTDVDLPFYAPSEHWGGHHIETP